MNSLPRGTSGERLIRYGSMFCPLRVVVEVETTSALETVPVTSPGTTRWWILRKEPAWPSPGESSVPRDQKRVGIVRGPHGQLTAPTDSPRLGRAPDSMRRIRPDGYERMRNPPAGPRSARPIPGLAPWSRPASPTSDVRAGPAALEDGVIVEPQTLEERATSVPSSPRADVSAPLLRRS